MANRYYSPDEIKPAKGTAKYITRPQCAAMYRNGRRAGQRCGWYAKEGSLYCKKHGSSEGYKQSPEHAEAHKQGARNWWARMKALEAQHPGFLREFFNRDKMSAVTTERWKQQREAGVTAKTLVTLPPPIATEDKTILRAHKAITQELRALPAVPDKPFEEMEPHEQLTVITGQSLKVVHAILALPIQKDNVVDLKLASMVKDTALRALAVRVKVDRNALTARKLDRMADILQRLKAGGEDGSRAKVIEG